MLDGAQGFESCDTSDEHRRVDYSPKLFFSTAQP
jgi:hypothetical protein